MTKKKATFFVIALLMIFATSTARVGGKSHGKVDLIVIGAVVGYDQLVPLVNLTSAPQLNVLVVRVDERVRGREESRYIKVLYEYLNGGAALPSEIFDGNKRWRFKLNRKPGCDGSLQELEAADNVSKDQAAMSVPRLKRTPGAEAEKIPATEVLPCYELLPRGFKLSPNTH